MLATKSDETNLQCLIAQALEDAAQDWWYLVEGKVESLNDFGKHFKTGFWNSSQQRIALRKIELGQYHPSGKYTRVQYATYIVGLELDVDDTEVDIIHKLTEHFEREARHALLGRDVSNIELLFKILSDFDLNKERAVKQALPRTATSFHNSSAPQRSSHVNVRQLEVTQTPVEKTPTNNVFEILNVHSEQKN